MPKPSRRRPVGFTLVELLVVIGIIALLISILLPSLNRARQAAVGVACKSMLRQYAMAADMYANEYKDTMVDVDKLFDYDCGLARYWGLKPFRYNADQGAPVEKYSRCPGDAITEGSGRLGVIGQQKGAVIPLATTPATTSSPFFMKDLDGTYYTVRASYGGNENVLSAGGQLAAGGKAKPRWQRRSILRTGGNPARTLYFADYQNNRGYTVAGNDFTAPTVGPGWLSATSDNTKMGSLVFRHTARTTNAVFLDGHVSEIRVAKRMNATGTDLLDGETWGTGPYNGTTYNYGSYAAHKVFYPFGPSSLQGGGYIAFDTMQGWDYN